MRLLAYLVREENMWQLWLREGEGNDVGQEVCVGLGENQRKWGEGGATVFGLMRRETERRC